MVEMYDLFNEYVARITPTTWELERARQHRDAVKDRLVALPGFKEFMNTGSYIRGTSLHPFADIDLFVGYRLDGYDKDEENIITRIHYHLGPSFPTSQVRLQTHSIGVLFSDGIRVDVVPGFEVQSKPGFYRVRDREKDEWTVSNIQGHKEFFDRCQSKDRRFRDMVRLVKAWKNGRRMKFSSYMLELLVAQCFRRGIPQGRDVALNEFFKWMTAGGFPWPARVPDPTNAKHNVASELTRPAHLELISAANYARARSGTALSSSSRREAARAWADVLDGFPPA